MLTRVEVNGFKSFQDFSVDLEPLVMVLGPNSAGKSNLFDALALISRLSTMEVATALQGGRGSVRDQFSRTIDGIAQEMSFAIELLVSDAEPADALAQTRFRYELIVARTMAPSGLEQLSVVHELLRPMAEATDFWMARHPRYAKLARYGLSEPVLALQRDSRRLTELRSVMPIVGPRAARGVLPEHTVVVVDSPRGGGHPSRAEFRALPDIVMKALLAEEATPRAAHVLAAATELRRWRFLHPGMAALRAPSERFASPELAADGSGRGAREAGNHRGDARDRGLARHGTTGDRGVIYLCAGLYAEGRSEYAMLLQLIPRVLHELTPLVSQQTEVAEAVGIDAPHPVPGDRATRIAEAIDAHRGQCSLFVVHADTDGDHVQALRDRVEPGRQAAAGDAPIVACIPVREIEAWMLSDEAVFTALGSGARPSLPRDPEAERDPKQTLEQIYVGLSGQRRSALSREYGFFGANIALDSLRRLPAFRRFEGELRAAVQVIGHGMPGRERPP